MSKLKHPCEGCALTPGAAANCEPDNNIKAQICVLSGKPFWCHDNLDWRNSELHSGLSHTDFNRLGFKICEGWRREVRALAAQGYFDKGRMVKRLYGAVAYDALETYTSAEVSEEMKSDAALMLARTLTALWKAAGYTDGIEALERLSAEQ